jgi:hypothetical protein
MMRYDVQITLTMRGPLLTSSSEPGGFGLDMIIARNQEQPYIPGTLLSGKLDQAWQEIELAVPALFAANRAALLGQRNDNKEPLRKQLFFSDLTLLEQDKLCNKSVQHRVTIDTERGAAKNQHLLIMESPFAQEENFTFIGQVIFFAPQEQGEEIIRSLGIGLGWLSQLGAMRSIGFGRVQEARIAEVKQAALKAPPGNAELEKKMNKDALVSLKITPQYPFCLSLPQTVDNLFSSSEIIPGAAVLGSLMTTWKHLTGTQTVLQDLEPKELWENFSKLRISHAFPAQENSPRPVVFPQSIVKVEQEWYDVALAEKPCLINQQAPDFAIDWKDVSDVKNDFGWANIRKQLRVRTGIEPETLRAAENELFSQEQIIPEQYCWLASLDLSGIASQEDQKKVLAQFCSLTSQGVFGLGKTKTPFQIECLEKHHQAAKASHLEPLAGNLWIITLQTDTLLGSPEQLDERSGSNELRGMYETAWQQLSDNNLELVRYFATQHLRGGAWLRHTMQHGQDYTPWLLTKAGSVFVLRLTDPDKLETATAKIKEWLHHGLPLSENVRRYYSIDRAGLAPWQCCPYLRENGYGEIAVNLDVHTERYPDQYTFIDIVPEQEEASHA